MDAWIDTDKRLLLLHHYTHLYCTAAEAVSLESIRPNSSIGQVTYREEFDFTFNSTFGFFNVRKISVITTQQKSQEIFTSFLITRYRFECSIALADLHRRLSRVIGLSARRCSNLS